MHTAAGSVGAIAIGAAAEPAAGPDGRGAAPFAPLAKLASGLSALDRMQDFADVLQLIRCNRLGEHFADGLHAYVRPKYRELWGYAQKPNDLPE